MKIPSRQSSRACLVRLFLCAFPLSLNCASPNDRTGEPPRITPRVLRAFPHDRSAFTQGLFFHQGRLIESTGQYGQSKMRVLDPSSGSEVRSVPLDPRLFGEGATLWDGRIVQLTWRAQTAIVYSWPDLAPVATFGYEGEGWGLASDGGLLIMSNGSDTLALRDGAFATVRRVPVTLGGKPLSRLNELEFARGMIYANVWYSDFVFEIDPSSGYVRRLIDCTALADSAGRSAEQNVLNGIAYCDSTGTFYLTGKNWHLMFEVAIPPLRD